MKKRGEERDEIILQGEARKYDAMSDEIMMKVAEEMWPKQETNKQTMSEEMKKMLEQGKETWDKI